MFDKNIRVVQNYKYIRDLHMAASSEDDGKYLKTLPEAQSSKENERKEKTSY
jgi:hypothetical protein